MTTAAEARKALSTLEAWGLLGCPGGPWKALEPLATLREHLDAGSSNPAAAEIVPPECDSAASASNSTQ